MSRKQNDQTEFDWTWAERREWITEAVIPSGVAADGRPVSARAMAGVLNAINDHLGNNAEAWPSQDTIAAKLHCSTKTVKRASDALQNLSLLIVYQKPCSKGLKNHYRIVWSELQLLQPDRRAAWDHVLRNQQPPRGCSVGAELRDASEDRPQSGAPRARQRFGSDDGPPHFQHRGNHRPECPEASDTRREVSDTLSGPSDTLSKASDTVSDEHHKEHLKEDHHPYADTSDDGESRAVSEEEVVSAFMSLNVRTAPQLVPEAIKRGCTPRSLLAIVRWFQRSQRCNPHHWRVPSSVLYVRLKNALPGVPAWKAWPEHLARPAKRKQRHSDFARVRTEMQRQFRESGESMAEMFKRGVSPS